MKTIFIFFYLVLSSSAFAQETLSFTLNQTPIYLMRKTDSSVIATINPDTFFYSDDSNASIIKIKFFDFDEQNWRDGFVENKNIRLFSNAEKSEKTRFVINYLRDFNKKFVQNKITNEQININLNPLIEEIIYQTCVNKNQVVVKFFIQTLSNIYATLDEKQIYALEEMYRCNPESVLKNLEGEKAKNEILKIIESF